MTRRHRFYWWQRQPENNDDNDYEKKNFEIKVDVFSCLKNIVEPLTLLFTRSLIDLAETLFKSNLFQTLL